MIVIAIIAVLITMLLPALRSAKQLSQQISCSNNERQIYLAWQQYCSDFDEQFPQSSTIQLWGATPPDYQVWGDLMTPYMAGVNWVSTAGINMAEPSSIMACPAKSFTTKMWVRYSHFGMNRCGVGGETVNGSRKYKTLSDIRHPSELVVLGDAKTFSWVGITEVTKNWGNWYIDRSDMNNDFRHRKRSNYLFVDGHVMPHDLSFINPAWGWWHLAPWGNP